jgi:beta-glucosidase
VQLYLSPEVTSIVYYDSVLRGFERVGLKSGEKKRLHFSLKPEDLMILNREMQWVVEPGPFEVMIGASSEDIRLRGKFNIR